MSSFLGIIEEIPGISVDRFDKENLNSSAFFLSHCHTDHEQGLSSEFFTALTDTNRCLYCTPITKLILLNKFNVRDAACIREIHVDTKRIIEYNLGGENDVVSVVLISAGHSLGSVMFLFKRNDISVLYTGDFRIKPSDLHKIKHLHDFDGSTRIPKKFTKIYLDTTFFTDFTYLPTREESLLTIYNVCKEWFDQNPQNVVSIECSHNYGSEYLYAELSKFFNKKIHVKDKVYKNYCQISDLMPYITNDPLSTNIHACKPKFHWKCLYCRNDVPDSKVLTIIPSVIRWKDKDTSIVAEWDENKERTYYVCYSTHSSSAEIMAFLDYFQCSNIHPCVCRDKNHEEQIKSLVNKKKRNPVVSANVNDKPCISNFLHFKREVVFKSSYSDDKNCGNNEDSL